MCVGQVKEIGRVKKTEGKERKTERKKKEGGCDGTGTYGEVDACGGIPG